MMREPTPLERSLLEITRSISTLAGSRVQRGDEDSEGSTSSSENLRSAAPSDEDDNERGDLSSFNDLNLTLHVFYAPLEVGLMGNLKGAYPYRIWIGLKRHSNSILHQSSNQFYLVN